MSKRKKNRAAQAMARRRWARTPVGDGRRDAARKAGIMRAIRRGLRLTAASLEWAKAHGLV